MGFITGLSEQNIPWHAVAGLVAGGVIVAPFAARLAGRLPHQPMGTLVGGLIIVVNLLTIVPALGTVPWWLGGFATLSILLGTAAVARRAWLRERAERAETHAVLALIPQQTATLEAADAGERSPS